MKKLFKNDWVSFYIGIDRSRFTLSPASYFDERFYIILTPTLLIPIIGVFFTGLSFWSLVWLLFIPYGYGCLYIHLPIYSGLDECDPPEYGFYFFGENLLRINSFVVCRGKTSNKYFNMPWYWVWERTSKLKKDGTWQHDLRKKKFDFYTKEWENEVWKEEYPFTYILKNGNIQQRLAIITVHEMEWRWKALKILPFPRMIRKSIDIQFEYGGPIEREIFFEKQGNKSKYLEKYTGEVGERTGGWKGGTTGCSYSMRQNETPLETLRRMEKERKF